jgi:hypothetical protein
MKKVSLYLFTVLALFTVATSCKKDKHETPITPKTEIPDSYVGKWIIGNVNPAHFADFDGSRDADMVNTIAYELRKDGTAVQFIYIYEEDAVKQTLTQRKGTVSFDAATNTLKFNPTEGRYRIFQNGNKTEDAINASGLYPNYAPQYRNSSIQQQDDVTYLVGTNDQNETVGFAKVNW